ncbi:MAG: D-alanyl-D-alanine carboxypeptidase [Rhodospirillales bacterium]|nr:D-alanyl-D-alanine carboxypeptidase [Rhodospirillales bacterium]
MPASPSLIASRCISSVLFSLFVVIAFGFTSPGAWALETEAKQAILMDLQTGSVLFQKNPDELMPPASMSKMMTAHRVFERLREGKLKLDDKLIVSENAWRKGGAKSGSSTMFLNIGEEVTIDDLLHGIIVQSGNDACIVVAEGLEGSETAFAEKMTLSAKEIGLKNSTFTNATGWPDPAHLTTARDLALLAKHTIETYPEYYGLYAIKEFKHNGIKQGNRNPLLYKNMGADGLKTGHTEASGYGLTASARRGDRRLIMVLNGLPSIKARTQESERVMSWGFREFSNHSLAKAGETISEAEVWLGTQGTVPLTVAKDLVITLPRNARKDMTMTVRYNGPIPAPINQGEAIAVLNVTAPEMVPAEIPLVAATTVERAGLFGRLFLRLKHAILAQIN